MQKALDEDTNKINRMFMRRVIVAGLFIFIGLGVLVARYGFLQVYAHDKYVTAADNNRIKLISAPPSRGYIYDRNGHILADNKPVFTAMISPDEVSNPSKTLNLLAPIFDLTEEDIQDILLRVADSKNDPVTIKIDLNPTQVAQFSERKPFFRGVNIQSKLTRVYPYGDLFAHVIGYVGRINDKESKEIDKRLYAGTDLIGKLGIENYYETLLLGQPGYKSVETNAHGDVLRELDTKPPVAGNDIHLSLDYGLQKIASDQLNGRRGAIVAIDPRNGDVLAFVSNPSYDPNPFVSGISFNEYGMLKDDEDQPLYNRALQGMYPPGSTIKPFESMGILHHGIMGWHDTIWDPGYFTLPGDSHRFRDWKKGGHGTVNMTKSIVESVDTYYYKASYQMGIQKLHDWMIRFGFGADTGIDLVNEKSGVMPSPKWKKDTYNKDWLPGETISVSIGQGYFLATPLQIANATAMVAAKGQHITPHLLKSSTGAQTVTPISKPDGRIDFNGTTEDWLRMQSAMEETVKRGTAKGIYTPQYRIAGKTGTAQVKSIAQGKSYNKNELDKRHWDHAWFNGFAPVEDPKIAVAVLVENGGGGSTTAAPIARKLFDYWIITREHAPITPPTPNELKQLNEQKAQAKAKKIATYVAQKEAEKTIKDAKN
ncbi:penicillin-binding protein 2 [Moraxella lincolnii]|uniref:Peptidoglycan D,D-transpeptidase MrdA n=1 Tax=Lwoffella lincolnii TaxID=90241 RepID=A0A1T0CKN8_9GAMM|nr:penicillin-binding protein 2 [Moraxella lincolnii]OOS22731.1 penicillin-binding protein 2 [Moraxella lincolnii]